MNIIKVEKHLNFRCQIKTSLTASWKYLLKECGRRRKKKKKKKKKKEQIKKRRKRKLKRKLIKKEEEEVEVKKI